MASSLNLSLTDELRKFIDSRTGDNGLYSTPSEYLRELIRKDMNEQGVVSNVLSGLQDIKGGRFSSKSIMELIEDED
ncbi:MAG: hypothetical protein IPM37_08005 [Hahellaceae bacterium]|nr:hypothetical protein [Hahellaceae bacterium]